MAPKRLTIDDYEITRDGQVINKTNGHVLKPQPNGKGYLRVSIGGQLTFVHRLVAQKYIPNPNNYDQVNHIDGDKTNNSVDNLEWVTHAENVQNAINRGTAYQNLGGNINPKCKQIIQCDINGNMIKIWPSARSIEYELVYSHRNIILACKNNLVRYGFKWKYYEGVETKQ